MYLLTTGLLGNVHIHDYAVLIGLRMFSNSFLQSL
uniref:Uncharacterized protein n=1 Tax=Anopheles dirus TaxID=7168 RepID=A0A2C9GVB5_9DIPT